MTTRSIGSVANRAGLFQVTVWQVRHRLFWRRYEFDCDVCELRSRHYPTSGEAWRVARVHAELHGALIRQQLRVPSP